MKTLIVNAIHFIYDEALLPFRRENIANYITVLGAWLSRIGLAFFFVYFGLFMLQNRELSAGLLAIRWIGISCFILASLCDFFDGLVARKLKIVSAFGELYDPHIDKVQYLTKLNGLFLDASVLVIAGLASPVFILQLVLIAWATYERDATAMFHRSWAVRECPVISVKARLSGKLRTLICFPGLLLFHLILHPLGSISLGWSATILILTITVFSTYDYVIAYRQAIKNIRRADH